MFTIRRFQPLLQRVSRAQSTAASTATPPPSSPPPHTFHARAPADTHSAFDTMLRVDHAGEYGAVRIYEGQIAVLGHTKIGDQLREMKGHEMVHLQNLQAIMPEKRIRPTALLPFWHVAGYALGAGTALLGERAAMACTVAVEEVITDHYNSQLRSLHEREDMKSEESLRQMIVKHRDDELEHRDIGLKNDAENAPFYAALSSVIKAGCHTAIWLSKRI